MTITVNGKPPALKLANLADLKRALKTPGISMLVLEHWQPQLVGTTREPSKVQTNGYWFNGPNREGNIVRMWADLPKAAELAFPGDDRVIFYPNNARSWTLRVSLPGFST